MSTEAGRRAKFSEIAEACGADLYRYALWLCANEALARDLVQETFLRAWKAVDSLRDTGAAKSWLITILRREHARTFERKALPLTDLEGIEIPEDSELAPDQRLELQLLRNRIARLAPKYREPLLLQVVMGYSCEEIARELGIGKNAVMTQLFRAREQLQGQLQPGGIGGDTHEPS